MWLHCAWCPDWGKWAFLTAAIIQKTFGSTRDQSENWRPQWISHGNHYKRLQIFASQEETKLQVRADSVLPVPCLHLEGLRLLAAVGKVEVPSWQRLQVIIVELADSFQHGPFLPAVCLGGTGGGRTPIFFHRYLATKIILAQSRFLVIKNTPSSFVRCLSAYRNTCIHIHQNAYTMSGAISQA